MEYNVSIINMQESRALLQSIANRHKPISEVYVGISIFCFYLHQFLISFWQFFFFNLLCSIFCSKFIASYLTVTNHTHNYIPQLHIATYHEHVQL